MSNQEYSDDFDNEGAESTAFLESIGALTPTPPRKPTVIPKGLSRAELTELLNSPDFVPEEKSKDVDWVAYIERTTGRRLNPPVPKVPVKTTEQLKAESAARFAANMKKLKDNKPPL